MAKIITMLDSVSLEASASSTSDPKLIFGAGSALLTMKKTGNSTSVTFVIYTSPDGVNIDTEAFQTFIMSGAGTKQLTRPLTPGAAYIVVKATNDDSSNAGTASAVVVPGYGL